MKMLRFMLFVVILVQNALAQVLYVNGDASENLHDMCGDWTSPCQNLEAALNDDRPLDSVTVHILSSTLTLNDPISLNKSRATAFHLRGSDPNGTSITCSNKSKKRAGFDFVGLDHVTISDIDISGCGLQKPSFHNDSHTSTAVFNIAQCKNVSITRLNIIDNCGTGIAIFDPPNGTVSISYSNFRTNYLPEHSKSHGGMGIGIYIHGLMATQNVFRVFHCTFEQNQASGHVNFSYYDYNQPYNGSGYGGGLSVMMWYNSSGNSIEISDCVFRNNTAYYGGGLFVLISDNSINNQVNITNCLFEQNGCMKKSKKTPCGGGAVISYQSSRYEIFKPRNNDIIIKNSIFRKNCAHIGGGLIFVASRALQFETAMSNTFLLDNCSWIENQANIGAAVDISPSVFTRAKEGFLPKVGFKDCHFENNFVKVELYQSFGSGTVFSSLVNVYFEGTARFTNNTGSALVIVNAIVDFTQCDAVFMGNAGLQGGAISLTGVSAMLIGPGRTYNFTNNRATDRGGAIYNYLIDDHDFTASQSCFISYSEDHVLGHQWNVSFYFYNNTAEAYGHAIFSSSIFTCMQLISESERQHNNRSWNATMMFMWSKVFHYDNRTTNQIATESGTFQAMKPLPFHVIPGDMNRLEIVLTDDYGQEIETIFHASITDSDNSSIHVDDDFSCMSGNSIILKGDTGSSGVLQLETISSRKISIAMNVTLLPCPPGFVLNESECICGIDSHTGVVGCDMENFQTIIRPGYWVGYIDNDIFVTGVCPLEFCAHNDTNHPREVPLPKIANKSELVAYICGPTRTGILCSGCKPGYSVFYHSPNYSCHSSDKCHLGLLFYILSELVPVTLMFVIILVLNINFTSGTIGGFILFSQLLDFVILSRNDILYQPLSWGYQLIYGIFTMEFFNIEPLSFCLWDGATVLDVLAFRYVTIVYAFLLVLLTLLFLKYRGHMFAGKYLRITTIKNSVVHGLSAFIILCYAQTTKVSIYLLIAGYVRGHKGQVLKTPVFFKGDIGFFSVEHLPYALPAITCLLTISTIPPLLLILYPSVNKILAFCKLSETKTVKRVSRMIPINKLKPFLDSFQGCFKDNLRFFAGIYFLYRWIALLMFVIVPPISGFYMCLRNAYILVLLIHTVFQPYTNRVYNIIDGCLFANLALIYSIAGYYSQGVIETYQKYIKITAIIEMFLIYLPIIGMTVYLIVLLIRKNFPICKKHNLSAYNAIRTPRPTVTSSDINDLMDGLEEFPARMLETDYEIHADTTLEPVSPDDEVFK